MASLLRVLPALLAGALGLVLGAERPAHAFPQWQLSSGAARCNQCHYAPAGGGLLTSFGRDAGAEQYATFQGNGDFLHGAVTMPNWLTVGGDLRGALVVNDVQDKDGTEWAVFPMQADLAVRVAPGAGLSVVAIGGFRGQIRDVDAPVPVDNFQPVDVNRLISRQHYLMWQPQATGPYVRAGRFYAPFGLRMPEHILYVNRDLGFDHLQESYNVSAGAIYDQWELHLTLFGPDVVRHIGSTESGIAGFYEQRLFNDTLAVAAQARIAASPGVTRVTVGSFGKYYIEQLNLLAMAEVDGVHLVFDDPGVMPRYQVVGLAGAALFPVRGVTATALVERNQVDINVADAWTALTALINWSPYAHCELQVMGRLQFPSGGEAAKTFFLQAHYFL